MKNLIMVVTHKEEKLINNELYRPIAVGSLCNNEKLTGYLKDNVGDNISSKNSSYCELTALYWVWKNYMTGFDNIGLCHYRRYFTATAFHGKRFYLNNRLLTKYMKEFDVILPKPFEFKITVDKVYYELGCGKLHDLEILGQTISEIYPDYYEDFKEILKRKQLSYCNMFVLSSPNLSAYCEWLFHILNCLESKIDISNYNQQERRVFGYLSEILLNVWVQHNNLKIKYLNIAFSEKQLFKRIHRKIRKFFGIK